MPSNKDSPNRMRVSLPRRGGYHAGAEREIDSRLLRHFLAVVEYKGFTAAAEALNLTQPGLTKSIQKLEQIIGVELLERHHKIVEPTKFGETLAARARLMDLELAHALSEIESMKGGLVGTVNVGVGPSFINYISEVVLTLQVKRPNVRVNISVDVMDSLLAGLIGGTFDIICTSLEFPSYPEIDKQQLCEGEHFVVAAQDHPLSRRAVIEPKELLAYPWVAFSKDNMGIARMGSVFAANHLRPPTIATTTNSAEVMFDLIKKSDYLASVPSLLLPNARAMGLDKLSIRGSLWRVMLGIAYRRTARSSAALATFIDACQKVSLPAVNRV